MPVTGRAPIGHLPIDGGWHGAAGLDIWECDDCGALINDVPKHEAWHAIYGLTRTLMAGRRNPYCSRCGNTRGGPYGHETSECTWSPSPPISPTP